ncbi:helix-turn-helix transcriptional regulator [Mesorhizobium sp. SP-1A]|uniref:helix-turn-helix domain-containing protein n=1 Tax=Mesorhizobium sp. SP-1A TaxID=3077840 RepID=UPI0028F70CFB|nr:helix-turn-helix transcriptional regulator [Mesorhizobium sp. SP-1A]
MRESSERTTVWAQGTNAGPRSRPIAENLRYLCSFYPSISHVCRKLGINRQQFNKYLSGRIVPSVHVLKRTSDFFGIDIDEMFLSPAELRKIVEGRQEGSDRRSEASGRNPLDTILALARSDIGLLKKYEGYYFRYNYSFDGSGRVIRSLFSIYERDGVFFTKLLERIQHRSNGSQRLTTLKYDGVMIALSGCLFNVEYERIMKGCVGHAAFSCQRRPGQRFLTGIQSSYSTSSGKPTASRVVLERITREMPFREMISRCGTFLVGDGEIEQDILPLIGNQIGAAESVLTDFTF